MCFLKRMVPQQTEFYWSCLVRTLPIVLWIGLLAALIMSTPLLADSPPVPQNQGENRNDSPGSEKLTLLVMDPLAAPLACDCVQGYAQRDYQMLGAFLEKELQRPVEVVFAESISEGMEEATGEMAIIIGKHSVIVAGAKSAKLKLSPKMRLTDVNDSVDQTGLIVVRTGNAAKSVEDLVNYRILFGPRECDEKHAAPLALLREHQWKSAESAEARETCTSCSVAAKQLMEMQDGDPVAAVISSYAQPLLEGCGNIKKGDLRVVGESKPVPFITAFVNQAMPEATQAQIVAALADVELQADLLTALETGSGFVPWETGPSQGEPSEAKLLVKKK